MVASSELHSDHSIIPSIAFNEVFFFKQLSIYDERIKAAIDDFCQIIRQLGGRYAELKQISNDLITKDVRLVDIFMLTVFVTPLSEPTYIAIKR